MPTVITIVVVAAVCKALARVTESRGRRQVLDWAGGALVTLALLAGILVSLLVGAWPAIEKYGLGFLTSTTWDPVNWIMTFTRANGT